jgi:YbbR domain-containing protein
MNKNIIKDNLGLKLLSVLIAIVIWYVVVEVNDPIETASFTVKVTVANETYIANGKQIYHIDDDYKTVTAYIKSNRSTLKKITADQITVTADLTQIVDIKRDPVMVPLTASRQGINPANITLSRTAIPITIENIASKVFPVSVSYGESVPGKDYEVGKVMPDPEQISINGPESIINKIDSVVAQIDVTGMTQDGTKSAKLVLYDQDSREISEETIEDDLSFDGGVPSVTVYVDLWKKQTGVKVKVNYAGSPAEGYHVDSETTNPETITVVGNDAALTALANNGDTISLPDKMFSIQGAKDDVTAEVSLADVLPDGLRLPANAADKLTVVVTVLSDETRELSLDADHIGVRNLSSDMAISYDQAVFKVRVTGSGEKFTSMTSNDIIASVDVSGKGEGDYTVPVNVALPSGVSLETPLAIQIHIKSKNDDSSGQ